MLFTTTQDSISDEILIAEAVEGNKKSLETLIKRHQDYIFNLSLKMFLTPDDALDATQEVLIKVITSLKTFHHQSKFRTWLYRIVVNHFLNCATRKMEKMFDKHVDISKLKISDYSENQVTEAEIEETRLACSAAMLMCLDREQRLVYIIGEIFEADHQLGAEIFDITPANFRVKLHRARTDLLQYVGGKCGLLHPRNPCRCNKKARVLVEQGLVNKENMLFNAHYKQKINDIVSEKQDMVSDEIRGMKRIFQDSPFQIRNELDSLFAEIVK